MIGSSWQRLTSSIGVGSTDVCPVMVARNLSSSCSMSSSLCQLILPSYAVSAFSTIFTISNALASIVSRIDGNVCPCMYISSWLLAHSCEILSALEDKIRIPARPCNILYLLIFNSSLYNLRSPVFYFLRQLFDWRLRWVTELSSGSSAHAHSGTLFKRTLCDYYCQQF